MTHTITNHNTVQFVKAQSTRTGESTDFIIDKLLDKAVRDAQYRSRRNAQQWAERKVLTERAKELELKVAEMEARANGTTDEEIEAALQELTSQK